MFLLLVVTGGKQSQLLLCPTEINDMNRGLEKYKAVELCSRTYPTQSASHYHFLK